MVNSPTPGPAPSMMERVFSRGSSNQPKAMTGGPLFGISSPSALIGRTLSEITCGAAASTPSMAATAARVDSGINATLPNSSTGRSSRSVPATMSSDRSPKLERRPSVRTNDETTNETARMTAKVVRARRTRLAARFLMVRRSMGLVLSCWRAFGLRIDQLSKPRMRSRTESAVGLASCPAMRPSARKTTRSA